MQTAYPVRTPALTIAEKRAALVAYGWHVEGAADVALVFAFVFNVVTR